MYCDIEHFSFQKKNYVYGPTITIGKYLNVSLALEIKIGLLLNFKRWYYFLFMNFCSRHKTFSLKKKRPK